MEQPKKIELYVKRAFGEKINASFDFLKENWKPLFKYITYLLLPLSLVQGVAMNKLFSVSLDISMLGTQGGDPLTMMNGAFILNYVLLLLCVALGGSLLMSLVYALLQLYGMRESRLAGMTMVELKPLVLRNFGRCLLQIPFGLLVMIVWMLVLVPLVALSPWTLLLTVPLSIVCMIPLALFSPIYLLEDITIWKAFVKSFRLGFPTWGGILLIVIVMGLISGTAQGVIGLPYQVAVMVKYFFTLSDMGSETTVSGGYNVFLYLLSVLMTFGGYLTMVFSLLGLAYQYGHASERADSVSVTSDIENFDNL